MMHSDVSDKPVVGWHDLSGSQRRALIAVVNAREEGGYPAAPYDKTLGALERRGLVRQEPIEGRVLQALWFPA